MNTLQRNRALTLALGGFLVVLLAFPTGAMAQPVVIGTESDTAGFIGPLIGPAPAILVASDGESPFQPFGSPVDVTDAIQFTDGTSWAFDPRFDQGAWQQIDPNTWILPAIGENEPSFVESVGHWFFLPGAPWNPGTPVEQWILDSQGGLSDVVILDNSGPNGGAAITFSSDPFSGGGTVPEPSAAVVFLLVGLAGWRASRYLASNNDGGQDKG